MEIKFELPDKCSVCQFQDLFIGGSTYYSDCEPAISLNRLYCKNEDVCNYLEKKFKGEE